MKVLIACEESQAVCKSFRAIGIEAYSCDMKQCSGGHPEWHIQGDAIKEAYSGKYDLMIAHPPCTYLSISGVQHLYNKDKTKNTERWNNMYDALEFVIGLMNAPITYICIENPISLISTYIRKPDQIINPWQFGDEAQKTTCLWLKNLPSLKHTKIVDKGEFLEWTTPEGKKKRQAKWYCDALKAKTKEERQAIRSKTFPGIANAMADQWSKVKNYQLQMNFK